MSREIELNEEWETKTEILDRINKYKVETKVIMKLYFILDLMDGLTVKKASEKHEINYKTGLKWKNQWNEGGIDGLRRKKGSGAKCKLSDNQLKKVKELISEGKLLTKPQIYSFIKDNYKVEYSLRQIDRIVKKN